MKLSDEQQAIVDSSERNLAVNAFAGTGKSSTLVHYAKKWNKLRKLYLCFNKSVQVEAEKKFREESVDNIQISTAHSLAHQAIRPKGELVASFRLNDLLPMLGETKSNKNFKLYQHAVKLLAMYCNSAVRKIEDIDYAKEVSYRLDADEVILFAEKNYGKVVDRANKIWQSMTDGKIPFTHDYYLKRYQLTEPKLHLHYDMILFDECLPYHIPVLLADGTSKPIGEIVENRLEVKVLSYNTSKGVQEPCKVTNWQKLPNNKPMVKIQVRRTVRLGTNYPKNFVVCTTDHKIWADGKWVPAGEVTPGMIVQIETSAYKTIKYKITDKGKKALCKEMVTNGKAGKIGNIHQTPKGTRLFRRGGNGTGKTEAQEYLLNLLGDEWEPEVTVTHGPGWKENTNGYAKNYKVDIGHEGRKIAIEIDGKSHQTKVGKERDSRKEQFLKERGWKVLRYSNLEIFKNGADIVDELSECADGTHCPAPAIVTLVEPASVNEYYVYDITVENCHNFYANGILVHNCQDANPTMADLVLKQDKCNKVLTGDANQAIYGFREAVDAMKLSGYPTFNITQSFRFPSNIAALANQILDVKRRFDPTLTPFGIKGTPLEHLRPSNGKTVYLGRTNLAILQEAFKIISTSQRPFAYEGSVNSALYTDDGVSIYDVYFLFANKRDKIRNDFIKSFGTWKELLQYVKEMEDFEIGMMVNLIKTYQGGIFSLISELKSHEKPKEEVDLVFSTGHKSKGLEYEQVHVMEDFISRRKVWEFKKKLLPTYPAEKAKRKLQSFFEEINLLYVAATRTMREVYILGDIPRGDQDDPDSDFENDAD